jgi:putative transposase
MLCGCTTCSASACATSNCFWPSGARSSPTRPYGAGARNSARALPTACDAAGQGQGTSGTWTKSSSGSAACSTISGAPSIRMVSRSTSLVQARRDANAAKRFFKRLLRDLQFVPRVIVTDKLRSYGVAQRHLFPGVEHRRSRYLNNRAENSHRPTRRRERQMQRFKSPEQAQDFLSAHAFIHGHFTPRRHLMAATAYLAVRSTAFNVWQQETCAQHPA